MSVFELIFVLVAPACVMGLGVAVLAAMRGRRARARRIGLLTAIGAAGYVAVGVVMSAAGPQRVIPMGTPWCFDDWCLALDRVREQSDPTGTTLVADIELVSHARRVSQRANGAWIYLIAGDGRRYEPEPDSTELPLDVLLGPGETRATTRHFVLPAGVRPVGLITGHGGSYCGAMDILVIGQAGCLFGRPTMIGLRGLGD